MVAPRAEDRLGHILLFSMGASEDDLDLGDVIWYTGAGGQTNNYGQSARQDADQSIDHYYNRALKVNYFTRKPVRLVRGFKNRSRWAPSKGFRYDGLYEVVEYKVTTGKSGYQICQFKMQRLPGQPPLDDLPIQN
ncbi:hypothetical protein NP233_g3872 [Leucocoprinus birnbaumii]|uniref:YDG domain-containing protein n=1 Tax=Leucocoprinus birnbaumii TaxID=56174 RepID=A0AAD5VYE7_9AGAR|nr:hypothetical protein NP233_g3872 [Leucocoprinus birnbaumii]